MASVAIDLNTNYKLSNGEYVVAMRLIHERKPKYYAVNTLVTNSSLPFKCSTQNLIAASAEDNDWVGFVNLLTIIMNVMTFFGKNFMMRDGF